VDWSALARVRCDAKEAGEARFSSYRPAVMAQQAELRAYGRGILMFGPQWAAAVLGGEMEAGSPLAQAGTYPRLTSCAMLRFCRCRCRLNCPPPCARDYGRREAVVICESKVMGFGVGFYKNVVSKPTQAELAFAIAQL
jgi:hypothetical protein